MIVMSEDFYNQQLFSGLNSSLNDSALRMHVNFNASTHRDDEYGYKFGYFVVTNTNLRIIYKLILSIRNKI